MGAIDPRDEAAFRAMGRRSAISAGRSQRDAAFRRERMVVREVRGNVLDVDGGTQAIPMRIESVPMTTACAGVKVGDVVLVDTYMHVPVAIGVMAR